MAKSMNTIPLSYCYACCSSLEDVEDEATYQKHRSKGEKTRLQGRHKEAELVETITSSFLNVWLHNLTVLYMYFISPQK